MRRFFAALLGPALLCLALPAAAQPKPTHAAPAQGAPASNAGTDPTPTRPASSHPAAPHAPAPSTTAASLARPWVDEVLYFVLIDRFADGDKANDFKVDKHDKGMFHGGDLKGLTQHLDDIASLGVTAIWINPIVKNIDGFVTGAGFPDWAYHGYWADDFTKIDPRFGTEQELKAFVDAAHARGLKVLLDVVYNHAGYDTHYLKDPKTKDWLRTGAECGKDDVTSCVAGLPDWKIEQPQVAKFLLDAQLGWARRTGVDGFRLDTVKHVPHAFWQEHRKRTRAELGPRFFLLGEVWGGDATVLDPWFEADELDAGFDFGFAGNALGWVQGRGRTVAFNRYLEQREKKLRPGHEVAMYLSGHDVPGALFQLEGDKELFRLAATLQLTASGIPVIYYGEEVGRPGGKWPENRSDMPWADRGIEPGAGLPRDEALRRDYQRLVAVRKQHPALSRGAHTGLSTDGDLFIFVRRDAAAKDAVVVAVNRGKTPLAASFAAPEEWGTAAPRDLLGGSAPLAREGTQVKLEVPPRSARIVAPR